MRTSCDQKAPENAVTWQLGAERNIDEPLCNSGTKVIDCGPHVPVPYLFGWLGVSVSEGLDFSLGLGLNRTCLHINQSC